MCKNKNIYKITRYTRRKTHIFSLNVSFMFTYDKYIHLYKSMNQPNIERKVMGIFIF